MHKFILLFNGNGTLTRFRVDSFNFKRSLFVKKLKFQLNYFNLEKKKIDFKIDDSVYLKMWNMRVFVFWMWRIWIMSRMRRMSVIVFENLENEENECLFV